MLRILAFDRKVIARAGDEVRIAVIYRSGAEASEKLQRAVVEALVAAGKRQSVAKLPVKVLAIAYSPSLEADLRREKVAAAYVSAGLEDVTDAIAKATRAASALSFSALEASVRGGLSVALVRREAKVGIVINLKASRSEGADLDAGLLTVAEVLR